jgi:hypothetical protein
MNRMWKLVVVLVCPLVALAQTSTESTPYQPAVPAPTVVSPYAGGYGGYSGGGTVAGNAMNGMANMISARGSANLSNSAAAINLTQAEKNSIENSKLATDTYFQMRATNRAARAAERGAPPSMEQLVRLAKEGAPRPLVAGQMDKVNGQLNWPSALQQDSFADQRKVVDDLFALRARYGGLEYGDQMKVRQAVEAMFSQLKEQIRQIPMQDYVACRSFLQSVSYAATKTEL